MKRSATSNFILTTLSVVATVLVIELVLSTLDTMKVFPVFFGKISLLTPPWHTRIGAGLYYAHPYSGYAIKPGYTSSISKVTINSQGFRGAEFSREKSDDLFRIVAIGGSTTYGILLPDESTYPFLLEKKLREILGTEKIQVINAGLVSATTAESLHRMYTEILPLNPDMIVVYHAYNDLVPRMFNKFTDDYYNFRKIPVDQHSLFKPSYLYRIGLRALSPTLFYENANLPFYTWKLENLPESDEDKNANFRKNSSSTFGRNMRHIVDVANANDIQVVLSTFAIDEHARHWNTYMPDELWGMGVDENNVEIQTIADDYNLPLIDFYTVALQDKKMFRDSIHMNPYGSAKKAAIFAEQIAPLIENKT